jgi:MFS family permease
VSSRSKVRDLLETPGFGSLYTTRLVSAVADGIFQAALASYVFFNPQNAATPSKAALAFAVLLLPYSIAGPFAGVFLDRWRRQRVLVIGNLVKIVLVLAIAVLVLVHGNAGSSGSGVFGVLFVVTTIAALGVNRFFLSALSAGLPHVIDAPRLISANALSTTSGSIATIAGAGIGGGLRLLAGSGSTAIACIVVFGAGVYAGSAAIASRIPGDRLGPLEPPTDSTVRALRLVVSDLRQAAVHVLHRRRAALALATISAHRFIYGMVTLTIVLLYRNYFDGSSDIGAGIVGIGAVLAATGIGIFVAAVITPGATRRIGKRRWIIALLVASGVAIAVFGLPFQRVPLVFGAFVLGVAAQGVKICVDTTVQEEVADAFRGRVFAVYDMLFNVTYVAAAAVAALVLPTSGKSPTTMAALAVGYVGLAALFAVLSRGERDESGAGHTDQAVALKSGGESAVVRR